MAYESTAVYDATSRSQGGYSRSSRRSGCGRSLARRRGRRGCLPDARRTTSRRQPRRSTPLYAEALAAIPDGPAKLAGHEDRLGAADQVIRDAQRRRPDDADRDRRRRFPTLTPGPGVWRLTPPAYLAPQTPWVGERAAVHPARAPPSSCRPAPVALEPRVGRGVQRAQVRTAARTSTTRTADADQLAHVLDGERDPAVQRASPVTSPTRTSSTWLRPAGWRRWSTSSAPTRRSRS